MQTQQVVLTTTVVATAPLTQQRLVSVSGGVCKASDVPLGVAEVGGKVGDAVPVNVLGILVVEAGGVIDVGVSLLVDDQGRVITAVAGGGKSPAAVVGVALSAATGEGEFIRVLWRA